MDKQYQPTLTEVQDWVLKLYNTCEQTITEAERREQHKYAVMVQRPQDKKFLVKMLDESSQIRDRRILAKRIKTLLDQYGVPEFLNKRDSFLFRMYQAFGHHFDFIAIPIIKKRLRMDTSQVIINEARPQLTKHLATRAKEKIGQNVNLLGEVVLGNGEADHRYHHYLEALESPDINYISVKISGIYAQTHALNYEESFPELVSRMSALYQKAIDFPYTDEEGVRRSKFINLDMEEYKDTHFTLRLFKTVLSLPQFKNYSAGIVVQAYLPDAYDFQTELIEFAKARVAEGGAPIKMRLVKGCNLEMETVISSLTQSDPPFQRRSRRQLPASAGTGTDARKRKGIASWSSFPQPVLHRLRLSAGSEIWYSRIYDLRNAGRNGEPPMESPIHARQPGDSLYSRSEKRTFSECRLISRPPDG